MKKDKERVIGFCCNECAYAAADLAGQSGLEYPPNVRIIRIPCSGTTDPLWILEALAQGAQGVFVSGCLPNQCHYGEGNVHAEEVIKFVKKMLKAVGVNPQHVTCYFNSAGMPEAFANSTTTFIKKVLSLPPLPEITEKSKSSDKRERFIEILTAFARATGKYDNISTEAIPREGFGMVTVDEKKCVSCGGCANLCETKAITYEDNSDRRKMFYSHYLCTACEACIRACPTEAITVEKEIHLIPFLSRVKEQFAEGELVACSKCGEKFTTRGIIEKVEEEFQFLDSRHLFLCPTCRRETIGEDFVDLREFLTTTNEASKEAIR